MSTTPLTTSPDEFSRPGTGAGWCVPGEAFQPAFGAGSGAGVSVEETSMLDELDAARDGLVSVVAPADILGLTDEALLAVTRKVEQHSRAVAALQIAAAAEIETRTSERPVEESLARVRGYRTSVDLVRAVTGESGGVIKRRVKLGTKLCTKLGFTGDLLPARFPVVAAAIETGAIGVEAAALIADMLEQAARAADPVDAAAAERYLVESATGIAQPDPAAGDAQEADAEVDAASLLPEHADNIRAMCRLWGQALDPDGIEPIEDRALLKRGFRIGRERDGLVRIDGHVLPETGALLGRLLDTINSPRTATNGDNPHAGAAPSEHFDSVDELVEQKPKPAGTSHVTSGVRFEPAAEDSDTSGEDADDGYLDVADERTADQKRHDALATILGVAARHPETPLLGGAPVTVMVQVTEDALTARKSEQSKHAGWVHGADGTFSPVSMRAVNHSACAGQTQRVVQSTTGRIIELETPHRIFNAHQRRAILLRDGGCVIPGCTVPGMWCEIHHVHEHSRGGKTHIDNGLALCWGHHRTLDTSGWSVRMHEGTPRVRAPKWVDPGQTWRKVRPPTRPPGIDTLQR